jgi:hypothetical protein
LLDRDGSKHYRLRPMTNLFARASRIRRRIIAAWVYDRA